MASTWRSSRVGGKAPPEPQVRGADLLAAAEGPPSTLYWFARVPEPLTVGLVCLRGWGESMPHRTRTGEERTSATRYESQAGHQAQETLQSPALATDKVGKDFNQKLLEEVTWSFEKALWNE